MYFQKQLEEYVSRFCFDKIDQDKIKAMIKGTVIMGVRYKEGTLMAGDTRAIREIEIVHENFLKVYPVSGGDAVIAIAGVVALAVTMVEFLNLEIEHYEKREETKLSFEGKAKILSRIIASFSPLAFNGLIVAPILASRDKIYGYDPLGAKYESKIWITGSGEAYAQGSLDDNWDPQSKTRDEAVKMAVKALKKAQKNLGVGPGRTIYIIEHEIRKLDEEEIKAITGEEVNNGTQ